MLSFFRFIRGFYHIKLYGYSPERFFNLCRKSAIILWDIKPIDDYFECKIKKSDYNKINLFLEKTKVSAVVLKEYGLPFFVHKNKKRKIFFMGIGASFIFLYGMSFFVWSFSVVGNQNIDSAIMLRFVNSLGVDYGTYKDSIDIQMIEEKIRNNFDSVSWVSVRLDGTEMIISIKENYTGETVVNHENGKGKNLLSGTKGVVVKMITRSGIPKVRVGDEVSIGTVLVEGNVPIFDNDGNILSYEPVDADADVTIRTQYPIHRKVSRYYQYKNYTGKEVKIPYVRFGQNYFSVCRYKNQFTLYDVMVKEHSSAVLKEFSIPLYWGIRRYCEYVEIEDLYGEEEGHIMLNKFLEQTMKDLSEKGVQIIENNVKIESDNRYIRLTGYLVIDILQKDI